MRKTYSLLVKQCSGYRLVISKFCSQNMTQIEFEGKLTQTITKPWWQTIQRTAAHNLTDIFGCSCRYVLMSKRWTTPQGNLCNRRNTVLNPQKSQFSFAYCTTATKMRAYFDKFATYCNRHRPIVFNTKSTWCCSHRDDSNEELN